jgi:putative ABC transport system ATP-binding protein
VIRLNNVSKDYDSPVSSSRQRSEIVHALRNVSLEIPAREFIAIMGPSGCGKSTLLHLIGGLDNPTSGEVWVEDQAVHEMNEKQLSLFRREKVGVIFQFFNLLPQLTVLENVALPLRMLQVSPEDADNRASSLLKEVGLHDKGERLPAELSGGEQQRVAIARALIHRPKLILADEPTGNLDSATSSSILEVLKALQKNYSTTLLLVTHAIEVAQRADRIIHMQDGLIKT